MISELSTKCFKKKDSFNDSLNTYNYKSNDLIKYRLDTYIEINVEENNKYDKKLFIKTFGCQMNAHDSERIAGLLETDGLERAEDEADADASKKAEEDDSDDDPVFSSTSSWDGVTVRPRFCALMIPLRAILRISSSKVSSLDSWESISLAAAPSPSRVMVHGLDD